MYITQRSYRYLISSVLIVISILLLVFSNTNQVFGETVFLCGVSTVEDADGNTYGTTQIGDQCWMTENMRVGKMVLGEVDQSDNGQIEKYCYDNNPLNCETGGGLYQWNEAMQFSSIEGMQGICPTGWHVPTDGDWYVLENTLKNPGVACDADRLNIGECIGAGTKMKFGVPPNLHFPMAGHRITNGVFFALRGTSATIWSSTLFGDRAWYRYVTSYEPTVYRYNYPRDVGFSVRCIQTENATLPSLNVDVTAPTELSTTSNAYSPNPFVVTAAIVNDGDAIAENVSAVLHLPDGLNIVEGSVAKYVGTLDVGEEKEVEWEVFAEPRYEEAVLSYSIEVTADDVESLVVHKNITVPEFCIVSPIGIDTCNLQKGDIILIHSVGALSIVEAKLFNGYWSHAGIYNGDGTVTESYPENDFPDDVPGVVINEMEESLFWKDSVKDWTVLRVDSLDEIQQSNAVAYAQSKADGGHLYNYWFPDKETESKFYCSQLVWRSFETQGVDLDSNFSAFTIHAKHWMTPLGKLSGEAIKSAVPPDDIYFSEHLTTVDEREGNNISKRRWVFRLMSPATILVTDEDGNQTGYDTEAGSVVQEIPGSFYGGEDSDPQFVTFSEMTTGTFTVEITGTDTGEYTFLVESIDKESHIIIETPGEILPEETVVYEFTIPEDDSSPTVTQMIDIAIKPNASFAPINLKSKGVVPVAILSGSVFDATEVVPETVMFGPSNAKSVKSHVEDVNDDGKLDLMLYFKNQTLGIEKGDTQACLSGVTSHSVLISGCGDIKTVGK